MKCMIKGIAALTSILLIGCSSMGTQFKAAEEASADVPRARLRVVANGFVKAIPNKSCIDWNAPGAGTVFGGVVGSSGYRGRTLNIPLPPGGVKSSDMAEFYVAANQPITLVFLTGPDSAYSCSVQGSFVPEAEKDYEASLMLNARKRVCRLMLNEIGTNRIPAKVFSASNCP